MWSSGYRNKSMLSSFCRCRWVEWKYDIKNKYLKNSTNIFSSIFKLKKKRNPHTSSAKLLSSARHAKRDNNYFRGLQNDICSQSAAQRNSLANIKSARNIDIYKSSYVSARAFFLYHMFFVSTSRAMTRRAASASMSS